METFSTKEVNLLHAYYALYVVFPLKTHFTAHDIGSKHYCFLWFVALYIVFQLIRCCL